MKFLEKINFFYGKFSFNVRYSVSMRKPHLFFSLVKKFLFSKLFPERYKFRGIEIAFDYACNFSCPHCNIQSMKNPMAQLLSFDEYERVSKELDALNGVVICFTGGEPLLSNRLYPLIKIFNAHRRHVTIQTNGFLLSKEKLNQLRRLGVDVIQLSLDDFHNPGPSGEQNIDRIKKLIRLVKEAGLKVAATTVVTNENLHSETFKMITSFCYSENILLLLNIAMALGAWEGNTKLLLDKKNQEFIRALVRKHAFIRTDFETNIAGWGCPAIKEKMYLSPYGDVLGCTFLQISWGNVRENSLINIRENAMKAWHMREYSPLCPAGEDQLYYQSYYRRLQESKQKPIPFRALYDENYRLYDFPSEKK